MRRRKVGCPSLLARPSEWVARSLGGLNADLKIDNEEGITFGFVGAQEGINYMVSKAPSRVAC